MNRRVYDITLPLTPDMPVWPGDPPVELARTLDMDQGAEANVSGLTLGAHAGTHVDAPAHFVPGGAGAEALDGFGSKSTVRGPKSKLRGPKPQVHGT